MGSLILTDHLSDTSPHPTHRNQEQSPDPGAVVMAPLMPHRVGFVVFLFIYTCTFINTYYLFGITPLWNTKVFSVSQSVLSRFPLPNTVICVSDRSLYHFSWYGSVISTVQPSEESNDFERSFFCFSSHSHNCPPSILRVPFCRPQRVVLFPDLFGDERLWQQRKKNAERSSRRRCQLGCKEWCPIHRLETVNLYACL